MRHIILILSFIVFAACNTPSMGFRGIEPVTLTVEGSNFDVRVNGTRAEAIRTNMQYASRMGPMGDRAYVAIEKVSGCIVKRFVGDQAVIVTELDC